MSSLGPVLSSADGGNNDYWDQVLQFHEKASRDIPNGDAGLSAIKTIRQILGSKWKPPKPGIWAEYRHGMGMHSRFWVAYEPNYTWLIHFAQKLEALTHIPGHEHVIDRLGISEQYAAVLGEMDFGLKVSLSGISCSYEFRRAHPTPDLVAIAGNEKVDIEITSVNRPYEDTAGMDALSWVSIATIQAKCVSGGIWGHVPTRPEFDRVKKRVLAGIEEATAERKLVEVNEPGVLLCNIVPEDLVNQTPSPWPWGNFVMRTRSSVSKKDRLARKIGEKAKHQLSRGNPSVLVIHDRFSSPEEARAFLNEKEIELSIGAFSNLAGVILVCPFNTFYGAVPQLPTPKVVTKDNRTLVEYSLPDYEAEICTIWSHPWKRHVSVVEALVRCLVAFPRNVAELYDVQ
jgi:hypothetical protein